MVECVFMLQYVFVCVGGIRVSVLGVHVYLYQCARARQCVCVSVCVFVCVRACVCVCECVNMCQYICTNVCVRVRASVYLCQYACVSVYLCQCVHLFCANVHVCPCRMLNGLAEC